MSYTKSPLGPIMTFRKFDAKPQHRPIMTGSQPDFRGHILRNFNWTSQLSIKENAFEHVASRMAYIIPRPRCVEADVTSNQWTRTIETYIRSIMSLPPLWAIIGPSAPTYKIIFFVGVFFAVAKAVWTTMERFIYIYIYICVCVCVCIYFPNTCKQIRTHINVRQLLLCIFLSYFMGGYL